MPRRRLRLPADRDALTAVCDFVGKAAAASGFDDRTSYACQLAVCEAVENIIKHGYPPGAGGQIEISAASPPGELTIELVDTAPAFDPTRFPIDPRIPTSEDTVGGRGLLMIRRVMDEVEYRRRGRRNVLRLTKNRSFTGV